MIYILLFLPIFIGILITKWIKTHKIGTNGILSFSSAYLFGTVFNHLFPEVYRNNNQQEIGFFILGGILTQALIETITKGIEHGHIHHTGKNHFPYGMFLGLFTHSLLEAIAIDSNHYGLLYAILIHKIPVVAILYFFLANAFEDKKKIWSLMVIFSLSAPLGVWIGGLKLFSRYETYMNAFVGGIFIHIATVIWFESSDGHQMSYMKLLLFLLGIVLSYLIS